MTRRDGLGTDLTDKSLLVTGGGTGIGASTAIAAARAGMRLMITGRRVEPLERTAARIADAGGVCEVFVGDVTEAGANEAMVDETISPGAIDVIFETPDTGSRSPSSRRRGGDRRIFDVNLVVAVDLLVSALQYDAGRPRISSNAPASSASSRCPTTGSPRPRRR